MCHLIRFIQGPAPLESLQENRGDVTLRTSPRPESCQRTPSNQGFDFDMGHMAGRIPDVTNVNCASICVASNS